MKLVPREVSNGEGNAVGAIVPEGMVSVTVGVRDVADIVDELALEAVAVVSVLLEEEEVVEAVLEEATEASVLDVVLLDTPLSCRR